MTHANDIYYISTCSAVVVSTKRAIGVIVHWVAHRVETGAVGVVGATYDVKK